MKKNWIVFVATVLTADILAVTFLIPDIDAINDTIEEVYRKREVWADVMGWHFLILVIAIIWLTVYHVVKEKKYEKD